MHVPETQQGIPLDSRKADPVRCYLVVRVPCAVLRFVHGQDVDQRERRSDIPDIGSRRQRLHVFILRAYVLAQGAAVQAVFPHRSDIILNNTVPVGQCLYAPFSVYHIGTNDRAGRTGVDAFPAITAIGFERRTCLDVNVGNDLSEHDPRTERRMNDDTVFAVESDTASLHGLVEEMLAVATDIHCLRDPTRGGMAATLNEIAGASGVGIELDESAVPVPPAVRAACEMLGLDPFYIANEGKLVAILPAEHAEALLARMKSHPLGRRATVVGTVKEAHPGVVVARTGIGGRRVVDMLVGEQLPRIC